MQKINVHRCPAEFLPAAGNVAYGSLDICLLTVTELPIVYQELAKHGIAVEVGIVERNGALGKMQSLYHRASGYASITSSVTRLSMTA